jgi:outer membrane protein TolC
MGAISTSTTQAPVAPQSCLVCRRVVTKREQHDELEERVLASIRAEHPEWADAEDGGDRIMSTRTTLISALVILLCGAGAARGQQQTAATLTNAAGPSAAASTASPSSASAESLTLEHAISLALAHNRPVRNARLDADNLGDRLAELRTKRLPSFKVNALVSQPLTPFDLHFEKGVFGTFPGTGPIPNKDTTISSPMHPTVLLTGQITQPLSQLHRINLGIRQAELGRELGQQELRLKQQAVVNQVKRAYFAVLQTQSSIESAEVSIKLYRELDRVTGEYVLREVALKIDQMEVETKLAKAEYELLTLNDQLASQKEQLNNLMGRDVRTEFGVSDGIEAAQVVIRETDIAAARARALEQRPEISEARLKAGQAKLDRRMKKSEYVPDVSLSVNYLSPFGYSNVLPKNVASVGVQVEWEVFDWGRRKHELAEKTRAVEEADNTLSEAESQVLMDVNNQFRKLQEACQLLRIARMSQDTAQANVKVAAHKYTVQAVLLKDVLQAQTSLADANNEYQKALLSFWTVKADFEKALGEDR